MRKILALLIMLVIAGPGVGFLCHCCPAQAEEIPSATVISSTDCSCCPEAIEVPQSETTARFAWGLSPLSLLVRLFSPSLIGANLVVEPSGFRSHVIDSSPLRRFSHTPLYLSLEVLRL